LKKTNLQWKSAGIDLLKARVLKKHAKGTNCQASAGGPAGRRKKIENYFFLIQSSFRRKKPFSTVFCQV
jgi:hypothetical protein